MSELTVYKTDRTRPGRGTNPTERIKSLFNDRIRLAIETARSPTVYVYFRAQKDDSSRSEQYFAEYVSRGGGLSFSDIKREIESRVRDDWGHRITTDGKGMEVFNSMGSRDVTTPGSETDRTVLSQLLQSRTATVGVPDEEAAIGLLDAMIQEYRSAAIQKSGASTVNTDFEMYLRHGDARRGEISYLGEDSEWENAREQVREEVIDQKVGRIQSEVRELSSEWGVSDREIRQSVTSRVSALRQPNRSTGGSLGGGGSPLGGSDDTVFGVDKQVLTLGVAGVLLLAVVVAGAVVFAPGLFGLGGESGGERFAVQSINVSSNGEGYAAGQNVTVTLNLNESVPQDPESSYNVSMSATAANADWDDSDTVSTSGDNHDTVAWEGVRLPTEPTAVTISVEVNDSSITLAENGSELTKTITVGTAPPSEIVLDRSNVTLVTGESTTVEATLRDEYGNTVRENGTTAAVSADSDSIRFGENGTDSQTQLTLEDGTATFELTSTQSNVSNVTVNVIDREISETLSVETEAASPSTVVLDRSNVTLVAGESTTVEATLRDEYGNTVRENGTTAAVSADSDSIRFGENGTDSQTQLTLEDGTATFELTSERPEVSSNLTVDVIDREISETLRVRTQQPNVSTSNSLIGIDPSERKEQLDSSNTLSVTVENGTTVDVGFRLKSEDDIRVTDANLTGSVRAADPNVTTTENAALERVSEQDGETAAFSFTATPPSNRSYTLAFRFDRTPSDGDRTDGLERQNVTVNVTTATDTASQANTSQSASVTATTGVWSGDGAVSKNTVAPRASRTAAKDTGVLDG